MLAELEEVVEYKLAPERRATIRDMWWKRLQVSTTPLSRYRKIDFWYLPRYRTALDKLNN